MSKDSIQPKIVTEEVLGCGFEEAPEDLVCEGRLEDHYREDERLCVQDVHVEYEETKEGVRRIVKVDDQQALERRSQAFAEERPKKVEEKSTAVILENIPLEQLAHTIPHTHGEGGLFEIQPAIPESLPQILLSVQIPFDLSAQTCFHYLFPDQNSRPVLTSVAKSTLIAADPILDGEPIPQAILGLLMTITEAETTETEITTLSYQPMRFVDESMDLVTAIEEYQHPPVQQVAIEKVCVEVGDLEVLSGSLLAAGVSSSIPISYQSSETHYFESNEVPPDLVLSAPPFKLGAFVLTVGRETSIFEQVHQVLVVLPPDLVTPRQALPKNGSANLADDRRDTRLKINRGSDSQQPDSDSQNGSGDQQRREQPPQFFGTEGI